MKIRKSVSGRKPEIAPKTGLSVLLAGVLVLKLAVMVQLKDLPLLHPDAGLDTTAYVALARQVLAGDAGLGPGLYFVSPLYIYFLWAGLAVFDSFTAIRVLQVVLGTASVGLVFLTTRLWFGGRAAWIAAGLAAATGLFTFYEALLLQASIDAVLTSAALLTLTVALQRKSPAQFAVTGVILGIASLNRPNMLLAAFGLAAILAVARRIRPGIVLLAGMVGGISPVVARNLIVAGEWSVSSSHGGLNFYIGNHESASGFYRQVPGITPTIAGQAGDTRRVASEALGRAVSDSEASRYFFGLGMQWIRDNPGRALALTLKKFGYVFTGHHIALPHSYPFYAYDNPGLLRFLVIGPWLLIPLGLTGLILGVRAKGTEFAIWSSFVPLYAAAVAVFFVAERYRLPLLVPLAVGAGAAIDAVTRLDRPALTAAGTLFATLLIGVNWPLGLHDGRWEEGLRTAQRLVILQRYDEAEAWVRRIEHREPTPGATRSGVGMQLVLEGHAERVTGPLDLTGQDDPELLLRLGRLAQPRAPAIAEPFFARAVQLRPDQASAHEQRGANLLLLERYEAAAAAFSEAVRLDPNDADSVAHLALCEARLNRIPEARAHARAALALDPEHQLAQRLATALQIR